MTIALPMASALAFVALIGRPNVGKSTPCSTSWWREGGDHLPGAPRPPRKPAGGRFLTTPAPSWCCWTPHGIHKTSPLIGEAAWSKVPAVPSGEVDLGAVLVDGSEPAGRGDAFIVQLLQAWPAPCVGWRATSRNSFDPAAAVSLRNSLIADLLEEHGSTRPSRFASASTGAAAWSCV